MARLRFPGCPGQRIGRNGVTFEDNKSRLQCDPTLSAVSNLQRSYNCFYELFGASDEDEEFEGFSPRDVRKAIQKLRHFSGDTSEPCHKDELISDVIPVKPADKLTGRSNLLPDPGGGNQTADRPLEAVPAKQSRRPAPDKLPEPHDNRERRRVSGRHAAQRLLDRAKRGRNKAPPKKESAESRNGALTTRNGCFQLPAVSARSSRRIIPRKRYLEDSEEDVPQQLHVQKKKGIVVQLPALPEGGAVEGSDDGTSQVTLQEEGSSGEHTAGRMDDSSCHLETDQSAAEGDSALERVGLFEQPLVLQGKRPWKPSLKVQLRLSEANLGSPFAFKGSRRGSQTTSSADSTRESIKRDMVSRYAEIMATREDGPSAEVPNSPPGTAPLEDKVAAKIARLLKSQWENRLGSGGSGPRRNVVLRKARLRLSQRTLKKLRQPLEESAEESVVSEVTPDVGAEEIAESPRKQRERRVPPLNGIKRVAEKGSSVASSESKCSVCQQYKRSAELSIRYGQYACRFCFRFYAAFLRKPKKFVCPKDGNCNLAQPSKCKGCLVHACWNLFDIPAPLKHRMERHLRPPRGDGRPRRPPRKRKLSEDKTRAESHSEMPKPVLSSPEDSQDTMTSSSDSIKSSHGPRIKHVCRRAAVVLGQKRATFSPAPAGRISLSALSEEDKSRLIVHHSSQEEDSSPEVPERNRRKDDSKKRDDSGGRKRDEGGRRRDHERRGGGGAPGREDEQHHPPPHERSRRGKDHNYRTDHHHRDQHHQQRQRQQSQDEEHQHQHHRQQHGQEQKDSSTDGQQEEGHQQRRGGARSASGESKVGQEGKQGAEEAKEVLGTPETKKRKAEANETGVESPVVEQLDQLVRQVKQENISDEVGVPKTQPSRTESPDVAEEKEHLSEAPVEDLASNKGEEEQGEVPVETSGSGRALRRKADRFRVPVSKILHVRVRKGRCNQCAGCLAEDCGKCVCCRDKKKFGGKNLLKQACLQRRCSNLSLKSWNRPAQREASEAELASEQSQRSPLESCKIEEEAGNKPETKTRTRRKPKRMLPPPKPVQRYRPKLDKYKRLLRQKEKAGGKVKTPRSRLAKKKPARKPPVAKCKTETPFGGEAEELRSAKEGGSSAGCVPADQETASLGSWENSNGSSSTATSSLGGSNSAAAKEARLQAKMYAPLVPKVVDHPLSSRQLSKKSVGHGNQPLVQALLWDEYERSKLISSGFPLVSAKQFAVQAVCFLCGSAGEEELLFCTVCCEPYHWFCLDTEEVPQPGADRECWCCPRCQACIACGHRSSQLLRCNKCQQMYHSDCLGPGYPSKPSRKKKIWVCVKCIRCKSCGTTSSKSSLWNFDLSLCHECLLLREKGNYCPLCEKCYEDDDYESMMVQCSQCQKWIHARCDGISEELYQVLSLLPETELYLCRLCEPDSPRLWLGTAERVLQERLRCIMSSLLDLQKASKDRCQVLEQAVPTPPDLMALPDETQDKDGSLDSTQPTTALARTELHFVDLIKVQRRLECGEYTTVKEFCEDILQATMDSRVSAQMVRDLLGKLLEEAFPGLRPSPLPPTPPHEPSALLGAPGSLLLAEAVLPPHGDHLYAQCQARPNGTGPPEPQQPGLLRDTAEQGVDSRQCVLCGQPGDDSCTKSGRLLYAGQDNWVHVNCALWSAEVFEQGDGALHRVHSAISRGRYLRCEVCGIVGATVGCCVRGCPANFHFGCAQAAQAVFQADKKVFCSFHQSNVNREVVEGDKFSVCRAVYVDHQDVNPKWQKAWEGTLAQEMTVIAGSMTIECLGHLTEASDLENVLVPVNYRVRRMFWSTQNPRQRVVYVCRTYEVRPPRPPPCEEDWGINVTTVHDDPSPVGSALAQCDISSANCDSTGGGLSVSSSDGLPAPPAPDLDDLDAKILDELARCVQSSDSQMDFAELLENISRSCDPVAASSRSADGGSSSSSSVAPTTSVNSGGSEFAEAATSATPPAVADQSLTVCQDKSVRSSDVAKCEAVTAPAVGGKDQQPLHRDSARGVIEPPLVSTVPSPEAHVTVQSSGQQLASSGATSSTPKCVAKPVKQQQQQSVCGCTCENRTAKTVASKLAMTPSRARSRPAASPKTILPKVPGSQSQGCQQRSRPASCQQQPHQHQHQPQQQQQQQQHHHHQHHQQQRATSMVPHALQAQSPCLGIPPVAATQPLVSYSPYAYNFPMINQFPSTINMTSVSCDKFEVYEVPGGTIIIPRQHYRLENCVSTLSMAAGAQVAYLGSLPLVAAPFMQPAAPPLAFIGGLGGQAPAPVMPLALQSPGVCGQVPLVAGSGLVANAGVMAPGVASAGLMTSITSQTSMVSTGPTPGSRSCPTSKRVPCYANAHRNMLAQKQCAKAAMMRKRLLQSGKQVAKTIVAQSQTFVAREQCTKCVVLPVRTAATSAAAVAAVSDAVKVAPATTTSPPAAPVVTPTSTTSAPSPPVLPAATDAPRSAPSPEVYPEPDSSTEFLSGPGRVSPVLLPPPQPPFSPSPQESPRGAGDSGSLGAESIFALLQKAAQRILQDGWPTDGDPEPCPPTSSTAVPPEGKEPVHSTVGTLPPAVPLQEEMRSSHFERPYVVYEISSEDGFLHSSPDAHEVWRYLFEKLQDARAGANMQPLTNDDVDGFAMMGLTHKAVVYLTEQLRGADNCENYIFKYHKRNSTKLPENPSGCARLEGFKSRGHHDMFKFLASAHRSPPRYDPSSDNGDEVEVLHKSSRRLTSLDLPMAMRFRHLKNTAKEAVGVYRSSIHGRGLYCKRNIDGGEMIIEYAGEVIRAALTDKREKYYESKGIGCYMFRIDDHEVVDATMHGNAARFINHSCEPNCYSKVISVDNKKHIVIFALRSILKGEELTYDYKFPIEDVKIPCSCGSRRCRKFLN
ncbi:histone-lysine N-methyltransferase 2A [Dermacentor andersoni]|uniref:histone-lysine N-methyltransferase 2A n=1 Tax=Dermacentor andersoni TaxID=34620 RepID=UPI002155D825|nr:histone-lysine N-methyltransferase 2A-like [Dermacentor andersoni]